MNLSKLKNPNVRMCLAVGATVGASQGLVRIAALLFGGTVGYVVGIAIVALLAFGFCSYLEIALTKKSTSAK